MTAVEVDHRVSGRDNGPVVVLSNSLGATAATWDANLATLERHFRVVRYDARGHGRTPAPAGPYTLDDLADDLLALLDRLDVERCHLVGLSLGGMTAMRLAVRAPDRVDRLALLCTSARLEPVSGWHERAARVRADGAGAVAEAVVGRWFTTAFLRRHPEIRTASEAMVAATTAEGYAGCCDAIAAMDLRPELSAIAAPTLAIAGADDPATPPDHLRLIADAVLDGRFLVVPDAAHLANAEQPERVNAALVAHLEDL